MWRDKPISTSTWQDPDHIGMNSPAVTSTWRGRRAPASTAIYFLFKACICWTNVSIECGRRSWARGSSSSFKHHPHPMSYQDSRLRSHEAFPLEAA